jgi:hypothetical protein
MSLEEQGEGFRITAAYGTVVLPEEAASVAEALRIVDSRMYDEKDGRRASAGRQSRDVLLRVLYERDARLQGHLSGLVELVRAVGVGMGLRMTRSATSRSPPSCMRSASSRSRTPSCGSPRH